jgi:prefoldin subunit 5
MKDNKEITQHEENSELDQYDVFLNSLNQKIEIDQKQYEVYMQKIKDFDNLYDYIQMTKNMEGVKESKLNIGKGVFVEAKIPFNKKMIFNIGLDIYVEMDYDQVEKILIKRKDIIVKRSELLKGEIIKNKSYYKLTKDLSNQLKMEKMNNIADVMDKNQIPNKISSMKISI